MIGSHIYAWASLNLCPPIYASFVARIQMCATTASYWLRQCLVNFLPGLALNCDPPDLCLQSSWDNRCVPLNPSRAWFW
jgi:hypothetical protein